MSIVIELLVLLVESLDVGKFVECCMDGTYGKEGERKRDGDGRAWVLELMTKLWKFEAWERERGVPEEPGWRVVPAIARLFGSGVIVWSSTVSTVRVAAV